MYVIFYSFFSAVVIWLVEVVVFAVWLSKKTWKVHVPVQITLIVLIWPTTLIASKVIYYLDTTDIKAISKDELHIGARIPSKCRNIHYHKEPAGRWFYCSLDKDEVRLWLEAEKFKQSDSSYCGPFEKYPKEIIAKLNMNNAQYFVMEPKPNGAGASVTVSDSEMFLCQWYW